MNIEEAIKNRHSVRQYEKRTIEGEVAEALEQAILDCNRESGLRIQLVLDDPECFDTFLAHYGNFTNANHYMALIGNKDDKNLEERCGYYGQRLVLEAQMLGLNTCWVAGTYGKGKCKATMDAGDKLVCVIAVGYGANQGKPHVSKPMDKLCSLQEADMADWFRKGVEAAILAPTAMNQQKFKILQEGKDAVIKAGWGPMTKLDLGIVKYNFEAASGHPCR